MTEAARVLRPGGLYAAVVNGAKLQQVEVRCTCCAALQQVFIQDAGVARVGFSNGSGSIARSCVIS